MTKKSVLLDCMEGDILASNVVNSNGIILAAKDTVLNQYIIDRLIAHGINIVSIYEPTISSDTTSLSIAEVKNRYISSIMLTKTMFQDIVSGKTMNIQNFITITELIYNTIQENSKVIGCLTNVRKIDEYTYTHCVNVAFYSMMIAKWLELSDADISKAIQSGILHDVGKSKIPKNILNKRGILTKEEYEVIKKHTIVGYKIVENMDDIDEDVKKAVLLHHERIDGSGYPFNYQHDNINIYSKIVAVADVFDAMTSDRIYKKRSTPFETFEMFQTVGMSLFDITIVNVFLNNLASYLVGSKVLLNNGEVGEIAFIPLHSLTLPIVKTSSGYIDLSKDSTVKILSMV